ncbi:DEAD/DEAH box helicase [Effusibacillus lacus]|uniref:ATP-dependent RNA helicase CshA n=1 Tax=Effusibacillus lacus TaxID=1348429 RepID=A0A292YJN9_9BACL|nr:DEAD/DEAH box helicase [Effusibacillus lacus]TCS75173.1 ATP-dependent RNA helicase DeaD [Effusibacillus lacus]GAX89119.1 DEAD/DEAH box helicase [Effusibacillus lacus]
MSLFADLNLSKPVMKALEDMGFESATAIQAEAIPVALSGTDMIGQAQTGTGKTVAFSIPMIERIDTEEDVVQGLILTPTRELCIQVADEIRKVGIHKKVRVLAVYGGQDINRQIKSLKNRPHIIIATPGRLIDHLNRKTIRLQNIRMVVLDEADEMLDMGFVEDIETILSNCPEERQTLLFSATMKPGVKNLAQKFMKDIKHVSVKAQEVTVPLIEQVYYEVTERQKLDVLTRLLDIQNPELAIVFGRTKRRVDELMNALITRGYQADGLHGDLSQRQRDAVMKKFRDGSIDVLVATDVAARGLDVSGVTHVYNFDIPQDIDSYVHRIGRTGRAGKSGIASTFVTPREMEHLHQIERITKRKIAKRPLPTIAEARIGKQRLALDMIVEATNEDLGGYRNLAKELLDQYDSVMLVSAALKLLTKNTNEVPITLTEEQPLRTKRTKPKTDRRDRGRKTGPTGMKPAGGKGKLKQGKKEARSRKKEAVLSW